MYICGRKIINIRLCVWDRRQRCDMRRLSWRYQVLHVMATRKESMILCWADLRIRDLYFNFISTTNSITEASHVISLGFCSWTNSTRRVTGYFHRAHILYSEQHFQKSRKTLLIIIIGKKDKKQTVHMKYNDILLSKKNID